MEDRTMGRSGDTGSENSDERGQRLVYVLPSDFDPTQANEGIDVEELVGAVWRGRWVIVAVTAVFAVASIVYSLTATAWYKAELLLAPAEERTTQNLAAQFGGLAGLAGINIGGGSSVEAVAVFQSRDFTREFIVEQGLMPILFADRWDSELGKWDGDDPNEWPDLRDGVKYFDEKLRRVTEDARTGLVTLELRWTDPELVADWANLLAERLNDRMRRRALAEAERNVTYLQEELSTTNVITLHQTIGRLLESELQKLMLARGNKEFSFRIIDRAEVPKQRSSPRRTLIVLVATFLGGVLAVMFVLVRAITTKRREAVPASLVSPATSGK